MVRGLWTVLFLIFDLVLLRAEKNVFLQHESATTVLRRGKRANSGYIFEELWAANLERECVEELCSFEEAQEYFKNDIETEKFWKTYKGNPCFPNPCQNEGRCVQVNDHYECHCLNGTQGEKCERVIFESCNSYNGHCEQFCSPSKEQNRVQCSCSSGYTLGVDQKSCIPNEKFVCGKVYKQNAERSRNASSHFEDRDKNDDPNRHDPDFYWQKKTMDCKPGECPWEAQLINEANHTFCGGTILGQYFVLTAAHCIDKNQDFHIVVGTELTTNRPVSTQEVDIIFLHNKFDDKTFDYDIAIVKLKEAIVFNPRAMPACIPETAFAEQTLLPFRREKCCQFLNPNTSDFITENMFCAGSRNKGNRGFPHFTPYKDTYFITGIASWVGNCVNGETQEVFTFVSNFSNWIQTIMSKRNRVIAVV